MAQTINTNIASLNAQRHLNSSQSSLNQAMERLSSGLRINSSKDDAAGLAIAERMTSQSKGMTVASRNANDGISMLQTAEGGLSVISSHLQRMNELATQAASGQYSTTDRTKLDAEYQQLASEVTRVAANTSFNGKKILGSDAGSFSFQIGAGTGTTDKISFTLSDQSSLLTAGDVTTATNAAAAMSSIATALDALSTARANIGAYQSRFDGVVTNLATSIENTDSAKSRITDADYASETAALSRANILQQAGTAMVAQANSSQQNVLTLLK
jgi:flagellin